MLNTSITGGTQVQSSLTMLLRGLNPTEILDESGAVLLNRVRTRFLSQVSPDGTQWGESHAAKLRQQKGRGGGTLYDTGRLYHSIQLYANGFNSRMIGTDVPYGVYHQSAIGQIKREFLGFNNDDRNLVVAIIDRRLAAVDGLRL